MFRFLILFGLLFAGNFSFAQDFKIYAGGTLQLNQSLSFYSMGWNGDSHCYPDMVNCPSALKGYAWLYDMESVWMPGLSLEAGLHLNENWRLELSLGGMSSLNSVPKNVSGVYYLEKEGRPFPEFSLEDNLFEKADSAELVGSLTKTEDREQADSSSSTSSFSDFRLITGFINVYFDIPFDWMGFQPYVGVGAGYALVSALIQYESKNPADESLNANQSASLEDGSLAGQFIFGADKFYSDKISYGVKASYTALANELEGTLPYEKHLNQEQSQALLQGIQYWTLGFNLKYYL